jgi:hypothetical protein
LVPMKIAILVFMLISRPSPSDRCSYSLAFDTSYAGFTTP